MSNETKAWGAQYGELNPRCWTVVERISCESNPVLDGAQALELQLDPIVIVVPDVAINACLQLLYASEFLQVVELGLQRAEEALHRGVVEAIAFTRHALLRSMCVKQPPVFRHPVLPALIRMQHRPVTGFQSAKGLLKHRADHAEQWPWGHFIRHDFAIEEIQHRRQVQFPTVHVELGNVRHPLFIWPIGVKLSRQVVRGNVSELTFVGAIFLHSYSAAQLELNHQSTDRLVVHEVAAATDSGSDATIAITPFVSLEQLPNLQFKSAYLSPRCSVLC